jgi:hypothetical protein
VTKAELIELVGRLTKDGEGIYEFDGYQDDQWCVWCNAKRRYGKNGPTRHTDECPLPDARRVIPADVAVVPGE